MDLEKIGLRVPEILLPRKDVDMGKWAVIACDQYLTQKEYWDKVTEFVGDAPSTLNLILPEAYLDSKDPEEEAEKINQEMRECVDGGLLEPMKGFVLVDRTTSTGKSRKGLIVALDLEKYDYDKDSETLIRVTEGTFMDKVMPRVKIRESAIIEVPHILVLIDDPERTVIEPLFEKGFEKIYDFDLMMNGGHITGYKIDDERSIGEIAENLEKLADGETFEAKYGRGGKKVFLYAMGDGNHSFATAKKVWEAMKEQAEDEEAIREHPARFGMVELVNVYDQGLEIEPIHRTVSNIDTSDFFEKMRGFFSERGSKALLRECSSEEEAREELKKPRESKLHQIAFVSEGRYGVLSIQDPEHSIEMGSLDAFLDEYLKDKKESKLSFIHGESVVTELGSEPGAAGFYLRGWSKGEIFGKVLSDGAFPRKTISMGHADDKRFYIECRKIV